MGRRRGEYKRDETRGKFSILDPETYKGDCLVQAWLDSRIVATISNWLDSSGITTRHLSDVVKLTLEQVAGHIKENELVEFIEYTKEARDILSLKYRANLNPGDRGKKNLLHNLTLDERRLTGDYTDGVSASDARYRFVKTHGITATTAKKALEEIVPDEDWDKNLFDSKEQEEEYRRKYRNFNADQMQQPVVKSDNPDRIDPRSEPNLNPDIIKRENMTREEKLAAYFRKKKEREEEIKAKLNICECPQPSEAPATDVPVVSKSNSAPLGQTPEQLEESARKRKERDDAVEGDWGPPS